MMASEFNRGADRMRFHWSYGLGFLTEGASYVGRTCPTLLTIVGWDSGGPFTLSRCRGRERCMHKLARP